MLSWESRDGATCDPGQTRRRRPKGGSRALSRLPLAALLAALAGLVACGDPASRPAATPTPPAEASVRVVPPDQGTTRMGTTVAAGGTVVIAAPENPSTGYTWTLSAPPGATVISDDLAGPAASPSPLVGAPGVRTWVVRFDQVGVYSLRGASARPWESRHAESRFVVSVFASPPDQPLPTTVFTAKQSPALWAADAGMVAAVCLEEDASTGYAWSLTLGSGLELLAEESATPSPSPSPLVGVGEQRVWLIAVREAGRTTVKGEYARPLAAGGDVAGTFSLTIDAREPGTD